MVDVAILAGGAGARLWPVSRGHTPKQFLALPGDKSLLEQAVFRARALADSDHVWIVTVASQVQSTLKALPDFSPKQLIIEPAGRNSAPAATLATFYIEALREAPVTLLVMPADHFIPDVEMFRSFAKKAVDRANDGVSLITFGLKITSPKTEYGYIERSVKPSKKDVYPVRRFIEKPSLARAKKYARSNKHYWNSGLFAWRSDFFLHEMRTHAPEIFSPLHQLNLKTTSLLQRLPEIYGNIPNVSIDYALMEKSSSIEVIPSRFEWSDLGTWAAVYEALVGRKEHDGNAAIGSAYFAEGSGNLVYSKNKPVAVFGTENLVIVETDAVVLVTTRDRSKDLKELQEKLKKSPLKSLLD